MSLLISLKAIVEEMDVPSDEYHAYLNKDTGELVTISEEEASIIESGDSIANYPRWQQDAIRKTQQVLNSSEYLPLPSKFDINEYGIMERFCLSVEEEELRDRLLQCIRGSGAFGRFKNAIHQDGIVDKWFKFRQDALEEIAVDWLESNKIRYTLDNK
jgi:hypothetical protein